jgi:heat shock protein HtpX
MNLLEQQVSNRRRTWLVMALFVGFLVLLGYGFDRFFLGIEGVPIPLGSIVTLGVGSVSAIASYFAGDQAVLRSATAAPVERLLATADEQRRLQLTQFQNVVDEMAIAAGLPRPATYVIPDPDPNAFATGRDPAHASIAVTQGLLDALSREQLQGVVSHEMSHIRNYDIRVMTMVAALVGAIALLADWASRGLFYGGDRRSRKKNGLAVVMLAVWLFAVLLAPIIARLLAMAVSRGREYLADASGAELTRNPLALASALETIEGAIEPTRLIKQGSAHLCIGDPLGRHVDNLEGWLADLFASHPPMARRIEALKGMAYT